MISNEPWYWTGETRTSKCGCTWRELAATDDHCEPLWLGGGIVCDAHHQRMVDHAHQLIAEGRIPNSLLENENDRDA